MDFPRLSSRGLHASSRSHAGPADRAGPAVGARSSVLLAALLIGCGGGGGGSQGAQIAPAALDSIRAERTDERNARVRALAEASDAPRPEAVYRIGPDDLVQVQVFGVEELSGTSRVSNGGDISLPLLGPVEARGLTPEELAERVERRLRETYMRDPRVSVQVLEMKSHSVSVVGAVNQPGVYEISGSRSLLQVLALAQGLSPEAGQSVMVVRAAADGESTRFAADSSELGASGDPSEVRASGNLDAEAMEEIDLRALLESGDPRYNLTVHPGDVVQVRSAGLVYVVGDVNRPGGFPLNRAEPLSVLQAVALAEGLRPTASAGDALILRPGDGDRQEIPVDLESVLSGSVPDPALRAQDILFIPNSAAKSVARGILDAFVRMATLRGLLY